MTDPFSIVIPWRDGGCEARRAALAAVRTHLARSFPEAPIFLADDGLQPWARGASIDQAIAGAPHDLLFVCDADLLLAPAQIEAALEAAAAEPGQVIPFDLYRYLNEASTRAAIAALDPTTWHRLRHKFTMRTSVGGSMAITRESWKRAGGHDPRFRGWGCQDYGFMYAASTLVAPLRRIPGPVLHLCHPGDEIRPKANPELMKRYSAAAGDPEAMAAILAERACPE